MFKDFKKLIFIAGAALVYTNGEGASVSIAGEVDVRATGVARFARTAQLVDGAEFKNYGVLMKDTEGGDARRISHPTGAGEVAAINNYGSVDAGDPDKKGSTGVYYRSASPFTTVRAMALPFLDAALIDTTSEWGTTIGDSEATDGINLIMGATIPTDYNNDGTARANDIYDFQGNPNTSVNVGTRVNYLTSSSAITIDTSDTGPGGQPSYDATHPCGIDDSGTKNIFHWPVNMGSKITGTEPEQPSTIRATGAGIVRLEGDNTFYQVGTVETVAGTTLLVTALTTPGQTAMPQSNITVGNAADDVGLNPGSTLTFEAASATTFAVGAGKTLSTVAGTSGTTTIAVPNYATLDTSSATVNIAAGTLLNVASGGTVRF